MPTPLLGAAFSARPPRSLLLCLVLLATLALAPKSCAQTLSGFTATGLGATPHATLTLSAPAPATGITIALSSSSPLVTLPPTVKVAGGAASATVPVTTTATTNTSATLSASYNAVTLTAPISFVFLVPTTGLSSVTVSPATLVGGNAAAGSVTVLGMQAGSSVVVSLSSSSPAVILPATLTVSAGSGGTAGSVRSPSLTGGTNVTVPFAVTTTAVSASTFVTVTASTAGARQTAALTLTPAPLTSIAVSPASATLVTGGTQAFTAVAKDQNGTALSTQPAFTWTVTGVGAITSAGVYSAGATTGSATVTATSGTVSGGAAVAVNATSTVNLFLTAAATGTNKITLYWTGATAASGYNVYRSAVSGGPYIQIATNVTTADTGPGLTNALLYSDMAGLTTGTEYFYVVSAVYPGMSGPQSNEASASPDANAIPWDTGNAAQIVAIVSTSVATALEPDIDPDTGDQYPATVGILTACGPDGVLYQGNYADGSPATAYPSSAYYDSSSGAILYGDGTAASAPAEGNDNADAPAPAGNSNAGANSYALTPNFQISDLYNYKGNSTGMWRKVLSVPGFWGASGTCGLPNLSDPNSVVLAVHSFPTGAVDKNGNPLTIPYSDSGDIYFGGSVSYTGPVPIGKDGKPAPYSSYELDLGLQASASLASTSVSGWVPVINPIGSLNSAVGTTPPTVVSGVTLSSLNGNIKGMKIYAVNETRMQFLTPNFANIADQTVALHIAPPIGGVAGGKVFAAPFVKSNSGLSLGTPVSYTAATLVYFAQGWRKSAKNGAGGNNLFSIKRTNSIAQTLLDAKHLNYPVANGPTESNVKSFLIDSSAIRGAYWGNNGDSRGVELNSNGSWIPWTDDSSQSLHSGAYPNSKIGGYGYVTWVKQNGFTWETNINLKANHTLP